MADERIPDEVKTYILLVDFLIHQEAFGTLSPRALDELLSADRGLYRDYRALDRGDRTDLPPHRAAQAVAEIQNRIAKGYPQLVGGTNRIAGPPVTTSHGALRYFLLVEFLDEKKRSGGLTEEAYDALVSIDPRLHREYVATSTQDMAVEIRDARAGVTAAAIQNAMSIRHPELAREFGNRTAKHGL